MKLLNIRTVLISLLVSLAILLAGCSGGGTSSAGGSGGGGLSANGKSVRGNVSSVDDGLVLNIDREADNLAVYALARIIPATFAATVEGIEVCIEGRCTFTDATGSFQLDLLGVPQGVYPIEFTVGITTYIAEIDVMDDALVVLENISISGGGEVRINNIRVVLLTTDDDVVIDPIDDTGPEPRSVSLCHKPGTPAEKTLVLPETAVNGHLGHGDFVGACPI